MAEYSEVGFWRYILPPLIILLLGVGWVTILSMSSPFLAPGPLPNLVFPDKMPIPFPASQLAK